MSVNRYIRATVCVVMLVASCVSLAPAVVQAAYAPPTILSYQGRLADSSGNLLGGNGTTYYFKFSLWDASATTTGNRLWPSVAPTSYGASVTQGVFTINIGDTANGYPTPLTYDFSRNSAVYLQIEVSSDNVTFETLGPRQQVTSVPYAQLAGGVVGTTTQSLFGTTTAAVNSFVTIAATTSSISALSLIGALNQSASIFQIQNNALQNVFSVSGTGGVSGTSLLFTASSTIGNGTATGGLTVSGTATTTNLVVSSVASAGCAQFSAQGLISSTGSACGGSAGGTYPFTLAGNATSTLTQFNGGLTAYASSTIGNGTQAGGLTISGTATTTGNLVFTNVAANVVIQNAIDDAFSIGTSTTGTPALSVSTRSGISGLIGIGTTTPWGKLSVEMGPIDPAFVVSNQGSSTPAFVIRGINGNGLVGIGTSSPFASLAIMTGAASDETQPALVIATTSAWSTSAQTPLLWIGATTTGALDYARVAIGATSTWAGNAGLRDQFTVNGRIYSTWAYASCDIPGSGTGANTGTISADSSSACGNFMLDTITDGSLIEQTGKYPPVVRLAPGVATSFAANEGVSLRLFGNNMPASSSPVMETRARIPVITSTSTIYLVGFSSTAANVTASAGTYPTNGVYFQASSTSNTWRATVRVNSVDVAYVDTNVPTTTTNGTFNRFRIEVSSTTNTFLIDGTVVAQVSPAAAPRMPMAPEIFVVRANGATAAQINTNGVVASMDIVNIRVWDDDPPASAVDTFGMFSAPPWDVVSGADVAEADLVDDPSRYLAGMLLSNATSTMAGTTTPMLRRSSGRYDADVMGVVSTSPYSILGHESARTIRAALVGRAPVIVSTENGPIHQGDRIVASSIEGVGMKGSRVGQVVGVALTSFDPNANDGVCDQDVLAELNGVGIETGTSTCVATIMVSLRPGSDLSIGTIFQDALGTVTDTSSAMAELANDAFSKGAELTKFVVGELVARVAVIGRLFVDQIAARSLTVGTSDQAAGITLYDKTSHVPYCLAIDGGEVTKIPGTCEHPVDVRATPVSSNEDDVQTATDTTSPPPVGNVVDADSSASSTSQ